MSRLPDLVIDSRLDTEFRDSTTIHTFLEIDDVGRRVRREERWRRDRFLGRGGFGQVHLGKCITTGTEGSLRAVKMIHKPSDPSKFKDFNRELEVIAKFSNDRYKRWFVKSFGWFENSDSILIAMEFCHHGDLHQYLLGQSVLHPGEVQQLTFQVLEGLDQMHGNDFAHRDLKPGNILIKSMPPRKWWIVLADFGISKRADESNGPTTTIKGTSSFMAPELLGFLENHKPKTIADFKAADMWALGEMVFQLLSGEKTSQNPMELLTYCLGQRTFPSSRLPESIGADCHDFIPRVMSALPQDRLTTTQCLEHPWIKALATSNPPGVSRIATIEEASANWSSISQTTEPTLQAHRLVSQLEETKFGNTSATNLEVSFEFDLPRSKTSQASGSRASTTKKIKLVKSQRLGGHAKPSARLLFIPLPDNVALCYSESEDVTHDIWQWDPKAKSDTFVHMSDIVDLTPPLPRGKLIEFSPHYNWIAMRDRNDGVVSLQSWGLYKEVTHTITTQNITLASMVFSPNGKQLAIGDGTIRIFDVKSGGLIRMLNDQLELMRFTAFSPSSWLLATSLTDGTIKVWDIATWTSNRTLSCYAAEKARSRQFHLAFSPDDTLLACGLSGIHELQLWNFRTGKLIHTIEDYGLLRPVFSPDGRYLASASASHNYLINVWDVLTGKLIRRSFGVDSARITAVAFTPDGKSIVSGLETGIIWVWKIEFSNS